MFQQGITRVLTSPGIRAALLEVPGTLDQVSLRGLPDRTPIGTTSVPVDFLPLDHAAAPGGAAVVLPAQGVLFAGPLVVNGPRVPLPSSDTALWVSTMLRLEALGVTRVVPGFGSWGGPEIIVRHRRFLAEFRRQVGYHIALGRPLDTLRDQLQIPADYFVWMPYDTPTPRTSNTL